MSGGFFRGTSADQDTRFSNKTAKLLKTQKFAPELDQLVDITRIKMDVMRPWIATRVTELLGFEDEVLINFIYGLLEGKSVDGKHIQIQLTGFMEKNTGKFMKELWSLLTSAQNTMSGVPQQFLDKKAEEARNSKAEEQRAMLEIRRSQEETREERPKKQDAAMEISTKAKLNGSPRRERSIDGENNHTGNGTTEARPGRSRTPSNSHLSSKSPSRSPHPTGRRHVSRSLSRSPIRRSRSPPRRRRSPSDLQRRRSRSPLRRPRSPNHGRSPRRRRRSPAYSRSPRERSPIVAPRSPRRRRSPGLSTSPRGRSPRRRYSPVYSRSAFRRKSPAWSPPRYRRRSPRYVRSPPRRYPSPPSRSRQIAISPQRQVNRSPRKLRQSPPRSSPPAVLRGSPPRGSESPEASSLSPPKPRYPSRPVHRSPSLSASPPHQKAASPSPPRQRALSPLSRHQRPVSRSPRKKQSSPFSRGQRACSPSGRRHRVQSPSLRHQKADSLSHRGNRAQSPLPSPPPQGRQRVQSPARRQSADTPSPPPVRRQRADTPSPLRERVSSPTSRQRIESPSPHRHNLRKSPRTRLPSPPLRRSLSSRSESPAQRHGRHSHESESPSPAKHEYIRELKNAKSPTRTVKAIPSRHGASSPSLSPPVRRSPSVSDASHSRSRSPAGERSNIEQLGRRARAEDRIANTTDSGWMQDKPRKRTRSPSRDSLVMVEDRHVPSAARREREPAQSRSDEERQRSPVEGSRHAKGMGVDADDDHGHASSPAHMDDRKTAKKRRKQEKRLRKEEKRRKREERHRRKEEKRSSKTLSKDIASVTPPPDLDKRVMRSDGFDSAEGRSVDEYDMETEEQRKLENELRKKALDSIRAKKIVS